MINAGGVFLTRQQGKPDGIKPNHAVERIAHSRRSSMAGLVMHSNSDSRTFAWPHHVLWAVIPVGVAFNIAFGAFAPRFAPEFVKLGVYAGEFLALAIWGSWGPGPHATRFCAATVTGGVWMLASWTAWFVFQMHDGVYGRELEQMLTLVPPAFAISTLPMWFMRVFGWRFHWPCSVLPTKSPLFFRFLVAVLPAVWFRLSVGLIRQEDLFWFPIVGLMLGAIALFVAPCLSLALLGKELKLWWLVPGLVLAPAPGLVLASRFPVPSGGGSAYLYDYAFVGCVTALVIMMLAFMFWRWIGIRN